MLKRKCAQKACEQIKDGMIIGLGGGSTILLLIEEIKQRKLAIQVVTPSVLTKQACLKQAIPVLSLEDVSQIDLAFDGCDEIDGQLNALKSCGGIHTREKLVASLAIEYVLLADDSKYQQDLPFEHTICLEVLPCAKAYVLNQLAKQGIKAKVREASNKAGWLISDDGNYLLDAYYQAPLALDQLNNFLNALPGVVGHSLFYQLATQAIIASENQIQVIVRENR